uniref:Putative secreted protein n=1 Tax=Anopheles darlingi TaxID=43151 RepID=A0A2M4DGJ9_ANODA
MRFAICLLFSSSFSSSLFVYQFVLQSVAQHLSADGACVDVCVRMTNTSRAEMAAPVHHAPPPKLPFER